MGYTLDIVKRFLKGLSDGEVKGSFSGKFLIDPAGEPLGESAKLAGWFTAVGPADPKLQGLTMQGSLNAA